nr:hypothetical protein [Methylobacterium sp. L1A1]
MIRSALPRELTQGTIFTCAASDEYPTAEVRGLIITARCDVAHGKAPIISYVPIVSFEDWLLHDGLRILAARATAGASGTMKAVLKDANLNISILETLPVQMIIEHLHKDDNKQSKALAKRFEDAATALKIASSMLSKIVDVDTAKSFVSSQSKTYERMSQELLSNQIADFHYLEACEPEDQTMGYVILMREIRYIPADLASALRDGIDLSLFNSLCKDSNSYKDKLAISNDKHFAMPIGLIQSPFLEFFMQRFTQLFARIGVTDISKSRLETIKSLVPFAQE